MRLRILGLCVMLSASACVAPSRYAVAPVIPPVEENVALTVLVTDTVNQTVPGDLSEFYTARIQRASARLPESLRTTLLRAGYSVITDPSKPHDVVAQLSADFANDWDGDGVYMIGGSTNVTLLKDGQLVERAEIKCPLPPDPSLAEGQNEHCTEEAYPNIVSAHLVNELSSSKRVKDAIAAIGSGSMKPGRAGSKKIAPELVAVFDVEDSAKRFDASTIDQITDYLAVRLAEIPGYGIVPRQELRKRIVEKKSEGTQACYDESCQIELGKALAASKSLATKLLRVGNACRITTTVYDLKTEATVRAASAKTECSDDALMTGVDALIDQLRAAPTN